MENKSISKDAFELAKINALIRECTENDCHKYSSLFFNKAEELEEQHEEQLANGYRLLGSITSFKLKTVSIISPFQPAFISGNSRSPALEDISGDELDVLAELLVEFEDALLRARVADVVWVGKRHFPAVGIAINSYLEASPLSVTPKRWCPSFERIERAFRLSLSLGSNREYFEKVISHIEQLLENNSGEEPKYMADRLMGLLLEISWGDPAKYSSLSRKMADKAAAEASWLIARTYHEMESRWHALGDNPEKEKQAKIAAAETYVREADKSVASDQFGVAAVHMQYAIEAFRRIDGMKERIGELHQVLLEYQKKGTKEMQAFSTSVDVGEATQEAIRRVKGKLFLDAFLELARMTTSPKVQALRKQVEQSAKDFVYQHLVTNVAVNSQGKVVGRMPNLFSEDADEAEKAMRAEMFSQAGLRNSVHAQAIIEPSRRQIILDHNVGINDVIPILSNNPLVPAGRELVYAKGIIAGLEANLVEAAHILIPQFENSVRYLLEKRGIPTSRLSSPEGIQEEYDLNKLLYMPEVKTIFGEDLTFDLQGLLIERFGSNLRNRMAHGLMSFNEFYSADVLYFWSLTVRLCCWPLMQQAEN